MVEGTSGGSLSLEIPSGKILSASPRFQDLVGSSDTTGMYLEVFLAFKDRRTLELMLCSAAWTISDPYLVTFANPSMSKTFDAKLVPYSRDSIELKVCIQVQGERRPVDFERVSNRHDP